MRSKWLFAMLPIAACGVNADVVVTVNAPGVQSSTVAGVVTESFDGISAGSYTSLSTAVGSFTAPAPGLAVVNANQFGGAGGTGKYFAVGAESGQLSADLSLDAGSPQAYIGFWLSALDANNSIELYLGSTLVKSYDAAAVSGFVGSNSAYKGNPNANFLGQDATQPFAYLNFVGTAGTTFDTVKFKNPTTNTGLEIDNISIRETPLDEIPGTPVGAPLPMAAWGGLTLLGGFAAMGRRSRR